MSENRSRSDEPDEDESVEAALAMFEKAFPLKKNVPENLEPNEAPRGLEELW